MALLFECMRTCARKLLDTADIVREAIYGTQRAGSLGSSGSLWEEAHMISRHQAVPKKPKTALITLSTTERLPNNDQRKSAKAESENTSKTPLLLMSLPSV
jgi:hypothetical protein